MSIAERFWRLSHEDQEQALQMLGLAITAGAERSAETWWLLEKLDELLATKSDAAPDAYAEAAW
jgi:hypothetical protein